MEKTSKIYIAGHSGLVGSALKRRLESEGYKNLLLRTSQDVDLRDKSAVERLFAEERPEYVFLAAAKVGGILANSTYPGEFIYDNLLIEVNVIEASRKFGVKKLLFLGSSCAYPKFASQPIKESELLSGKLEPTNEPYAVAKIAGITLCQAYRRQYGSNFICVMPTNLFGPNDNFDLLDSHVLPALIRKIHLAKLLSRNENDLIRRDLERFGNKPPSDAENLAVYLATFGIFPDRIILWGTGKPRREFLYVDDLASACVFIMNCYDEPHIINIGTGNDISISDLASFVSKILGFNGTIIFDPSKPDGTPRKLLDVGKLHSIGWSHTTGLEEGIRNTYEWYLHAIKDWKNG